MTPKTGQGVNLLKSDQFESNIKVLQEDYAPGPLYRQTQGRFQGRKKDFREKCPPPQKKRKRGGNWQNKTCFPNFRPICSLGRSEKNSCLGQQKIQLDF